MSYDLPIVASIQYSGKRKEEEKKKAIQHTQTHSLYFISGRWLLENSSLGTYCFSIPAKSVRTAHNNNNNQ